MDDPNLSVVYPTVITPAMMIASNVPENDYPVWSNATTYAAKDRVIKNHKIYESVVAGNVGNDPELNNIEKWLFVSATNRWKAYDNSVSTQTKQATLITYQLRFPMVVSALALLNVTGASKITGYMVAPGYGEVYRREFDFLGVPPGSDWWSFFFGEWVGPSQAIFTDLPNFPGADLFIEIEGSADLAVGVILTGQIRIFSYGVAQGARLGIQDFSRKERNTWGDMVVVERAFAKRASLPMLLDAAEVDSFYTFLAGVRAVPCLWIGSQRYESAVIYGFYKSFDIIISYYNQSDCELEIEGLT